MRKTIYLSITSQSESGVPLTHSQIPVSVDFDCPPVKSVKSYSTDELIAELYRRSLNSELTED